MQVSETFTRVIGVTLAAVGIVAAILFVGVVIEPHSHVYAQGAGVVGIQTKEVSVFAAQAASGSSGGFWQCGATGGTACAVLPDNGFASNVLSFCNTNFSGSIDLEWSPTGSAPFYPLTTANYTNDTNCVTNAPNQHVLQLGGYFPNLRSSVTRTAGSVSAWYTASAAPISFFPSAIGSNGPTAPIQCDQATGASIVTTGTTQLFALPNSRGVAVCGFTISFTGTPSSVVSAVQVGYNSACPLINSWAISTTPSTPQTIVVGSGIGTIFQSPPNVSDLCVGNSSGVNIEVSITYAFL